MVTKARAITPPGSLHELGVILTLGGMQSVAMGLTLIRSKVIALLIAPQGVGIVSVVDQLVQVIVQVCALSLPIAPVKFVSRALHEGAEAVGNIYQALLKMLLISCLTGTALSMFVVTLRGDILGPELRQYKTVVLIALTTVPVMALGGLLANVLAAARSYRTSALYSLLLSLAAVIATYAGITLAALPGLYYANLAIGLAGVAAGIGYLWIALGMAPHTPAFRPRQELQRYSGIVSFSAVFYVLSFAQPLSLLIGRYAVLKYLGPTEAGYLQASLAISAVISTLVFQSIRLYLWPIVNQSIPQTEKFKKGNDFQRSATVLAFLAALVVVAFPREVTGLLFSSAFLAISPYLFMFVVAEYMLLLATVYQSLVVGVDDLRNFLSTTLLSHLAVVVLPWILIPGYGLLGVAWAFIVARATLLLLTIVGLRVRHGFRIPGNLAGLMAGCMIALALSGLLFRGSSALSANGIFFRAVAFVFSASCGLLFLKRHG